MSKKNINILANIEDTFFRLYWIVFICLTLFLMNLSGFSFLVHIQPVGDQPPNYIVAVAEFIRTILFGWLFFGVYWKGNNFFKIPDEVLKKQGYYFKLSIKETFFAGIWAVTVGEITYRILDVQKQAIDQRVFYILLAIILGWTGYRCYRWTIQRKEEKDTFVAIPDLTLQAKAFSKIGKHLNNEEQELLRTLVYESKMFARFSIQRIISITIWVVIASLLIEIAQEFLQRL